MSAPLFQANRMPECRVIFSHSTVVFGAGSTESTRTEDNVLNNERKCNANESFYSESLAAGSLDQLPAPLERILADA